MNFGEKEATRSIVGHGPLLFDRQASRHFGPISLFPTEKVFSPFFIYPYMCALGQIWRNIANVIICKVFGVIFVVLINKIAYLLGFYFYLISIKKSILKNILETYF